MAESLSTIGSIATHLVNTIVGLSAGISGNLLPIVDMARQHVSNYTGQNIGSNSISDKYQPAILDFSKADIIDLVNADSGGESISIEGLSIDNKGEGLSAEQYRLLGEMKLKSLGRSIQVVKSLS
jgi:hypothetical protein